MQKNIHITHKDDKGQINNPHPISNGVKRLLITTFIFGSLLVASSANAQMMNFGFWPFGGFGWIFMIFWWVLIIAGIFALIKWLTSQSRGTDNHAKSALEILQERYAKGEINKQEFEEKKKDLS
ncbi:MAG: hypothetical protein UU89_C0026G0014 [Parcubacteria group bacterium GW2011_GWC2_42_11]|nr:MAG: hypothetical protein UU89_C0026G0014 [Parcubacteria group bacterium GW2011_GWC2_42_11]